MLVISTFHNRELIYHPDKPYYNKMTTSLEETPSNVQVISTYPLFHNLEGIRFFFKAVIQIFTFITVVIYFYIMTLILKQVYEEKEI